MTDIIRDRSLDFDMFFYDELARLRDLIKNTNSDFGNLQASLQQTGMIEAQNDLNKVMQESEMAVNKILDYTQTIEKLASDSANTIKINELATQIYENCAFQDLTGQKITRAIKTMIVVEQIVDEILRQLPLKHAMPSTTTNQKHNANWKKDANQADHHLLNGPQNEPVCQSTIDDIFNK